MVEIWNAVEEAARRVMPYLFDLTCVSVLPAKHVGTRTPAGPLVSWFRRRFGSSDPSDNLGPAAVRPDPQETHELAARRHPRHR